LKLYEKLADEIEQAVRRGVFAAGERILSIRQASQQHGVGIKTVLHAYALLESRGVVETRPQSGYFVREPAEPQTARNPVMPVTAVASEVDVSRLVLATLRSIRAHDAVQSVCKRYRATSYELEPD
jgi:DNA-binding transcriptional regulator YhcF (GntR family)